MIRRANLAALTICFLASTSDAATFLVSNTNASGAGSLAQAITSANATTTSDTINFDILGLGPHVISADLPTITQPVLINGYSEPGSIENTSNNLGTNAVIKIGLNGQSLPTGEPVLEISADNVTIRGLAIYGMKNEGIGIHVTSAAQNVSIRGCFVGLTAAGTQNSTGTGIRVDGTANIGSNTNNHRNVISGNDVAGILLRGPGSLVRNNLIGANLSANEAISNGDGILLSTANSTSNRIGGDWETERNAIVASNNRGIRLDVTAGDGNVFQNNIMSQNSKLGIDLGGDGVTPNDEDDSDDGPNRLQNFPELAFARSNDVHVRVDGALSGQPGTYEIAFLGIAIPHPSGYGESALPIGTKEVEIGIDSTSVGFSAALTLEQPPDGFYVTATARNVVTNDTSEFARNVFTPAAQSILTVTNTNDVGAGSLRAAILAANEAEGTQTIVFNIPGPGPHTILPLSEYTISESVIVDGYSQPSSSPNTLPEGSNADLRIVISGAQLPGEAGGVFAVLGADTSIRGLVIHSAPQHGIRSANSDRVQIEGCFIGTDVTGEIDLGNGMSAISTGASRDMIIGGPARGQRNVLSGNGHYGILNNAERTIIMNNVIGASASLDGPLGNGLGGIIASNAVGDIGSDEAREGNVIRFNGGAGITISSGGSGQTILGNSIDANGSLGIDIAPSPGPASVTPNDANDSDSGPNDRQNFPVLESVSLSNGQLTVEGTLEVPVTESVYMIRVYASESCDPSGHGEGATFVGREAVLQSGADETFSFTIDADLGGTEQITATATQVILGNTSEFSACASLGGSQALCGDASGDETINASDALTALRTAVGTASCQACACDVNGQGGITSSDALLILRKAVGQQVSMSCPACV